jgi:hypothetical protein
MMLHDGISRPDLMYFAFIAYQKIEQRFIYRGGSKWT